MQPSVPNLFKYQGNPLWLRPVFFVIQGSAAVEPDTFILVHTQVWLVAWQRLSV
jgi:hypothetical protein